MLTNLQIDARYDPAFLRALAGITDSQPFGYGQPTPYATPMPGVAPAVNPGMQTIYFDDSFSEAMIAAINGYDAAWLNKIKAERTEAVNVERDTRIEGGYDFVHDDETYLIQSAQSDRENVIGLAVAAMGALSQGADAGDLEWLVPGMPFGFIAADNRAIPLDAAGMMALYQRGLGFKMSVTLYARALKDACLAAADLEALADVNTTAGWPE
jgi:hypothetical protein